MERDRKSAPDVPDDMFTNMQNYLRCDFPFAIFDTWTTNKNGGCSLIEVWTLLPGHKPTLCMAWVGTLVLASLSSLWTVKSKETGCCSFLRKLVIPSPLRGCLRSPCWNLATFPHHFWPWFIKNRPINQVFPAGWGSTFTFLLCCSLHIKLEEFILQCFLDLIWLIELLGLVNIKRH